jgi:hypothetical protein
VRHASAGAAMAGMGWWTELAGVSARRRTRGIGNGTMAVARQTAGKRRILKPLQTAPAASPVRLGVSGTVAVLEDRGLIRGNGNAEAGDRERRRPGFRERAAGGSGTPTRGNMLIARPISKA